MIIMKRLREHRQNNQLPRGRDLMKRGKDDIMNHTHTHHTHKHWRNMSNQVETNIKYCIDDLNLNDAQIGEMLRCIEKMGISSVQYFCDEFVFTCEDEDGNHDMDALDRVHHDAYLNIAVFNGMYWEYED